MPRGRLVEFWQRQAREIAEDPALRAYGIALCVGHLLAALFWVRMPLAEVLGPGAMPVCWPMFDGCAKWSRDGEFWQAVLLAYAALAALTGSLLGGKRARWGVASFGLLFLVHLLVLFQDFRLRLNQHTMLMWVGLVFLLAPSKRLSLRVLVVAFYFFAGLLKLDHEWLSGAALGGHPPMLVPAALVPAACWYVVVLELGLVWGLFSRQKWLFWATLAQLGLFHLTSFGIVGFFYPLLMAALLSIFVLDRRFDSGADRERWQHAALALVPFGFSQLMPLLMPGDSALTGQGRFLALHMFDAKVACSATAKLRFADKPDEQVRLRTKLPGRIACDPLVYYHLARGLCTRQLAADPRFSDLDLKLVSRRRTGPLVTVVDQPAFCTSPVSYSAWWPNAWINGR